MDTKLQGKFYADTIDGMIYLELLSGGNCVAYFQGGEEDGGYWRIQSDGSIHILATPKKETSKSSVKYWISGDGKVYNKDSFSIPAERHYFYLYSSEDKETTLYFSRR